MASPKKTNEIRLEENAEMESRSEENVKSSSVEESANSSSGTPASHKTPTNQKKKVGGKICLKVLILLLKVSNYTQEIKQA